MIAIEKARMLIRQDPTGRSAAVLTRLLESLESGSEFALAEIYDIGYSEFELCLEIIAGWRLHRHRHPLRREHRVGRDSQLACS